MAISGRTLTRRELYDMVWTTPMSRLAQDLGISDVGLKKVCNRHRVPTPGRGYWAQLEAGKNPKKVLFTEVSDAALNRIEIRPGLIDLPEPVRQVIEAQKAERKLAATRLQPAPKSASTYEPVTNIHPTVRLTVQALRRCKPSDASAAAFGDGLCGVTVGKESIERTAYILDRLARALETKGTPLVPTGRAMQVSVGPDEAIFSLKERTRTVPHVPTAEELAQEARREQQRERYWRNPNQWRAPPFGRGYPENDTVWTGELSIQIEGYTDGVRRTWADGRTQRLDDLVPSVVDGITVLLAARKAAREEREERDRRYAELQRRHGLARARANREEARSAFATEIVNLTREAETLRAWLAYGHLTQTSSTDGQVARFRAWMENRLRRSKAGSTWLQWSACSPKRNSSQAWNRTSCTIHWGSRPPCAGTERLPPHQPHAGPAPSPQRASRTPNGRPIAAAGCSEFGHSDRHGDRYCVSTARDSAYDERADHLFESGRA